jgi:cell wall-associated NlpC family hydrolase
MTAAAPPRQRILDAALALRDLVGVPYERGARGPAAFDCWGLVLEVRRRLQLPAPPDYASAQLAPLDVLALFHAEPPPGWERVAPRDGAIVLALDAGHAGVFVAGRVLHAVRRGGVIAWRLGIWQAVYGHEGGCWECRSR